MVFRVVRVATTALLLLVAALHCPAQAAPQPSDKQTEFAAHVQKARSYLDERRPDLAIPELQAAVDLNPGDVNTQGNLGVLLFFQGKPADAVPHLRAAVEADPSLIRIQGILGLAELHTGDVDQGRKDLNSVFPQIADAKFKVQVGLELVGSYTETGDLDQAASILAQLRKAAPDNPEVLYAAYRTYSDLSVEARLSLSVAAPDSAQMHQLLAHEELREGNTNAAIAQFRKALQIDPHLPSIHYELGEVLNTSADPSVKQEAEAEFRAALQENPHSEQALCALAAIAAQKGDTQQALQEYTEAVRLQPSDAAAHLGLAKALTDSGQSDKALPELEEAVRLEPTDPTAHYRLALLYRKAGRTDDAKRELELYSQYKQMKEKLRALYKDLLIQPKEIQPDSQDEK